MYQHINETTTKKAACLSIDSQRLYLSKNPKYFMWLDLRPSGHVTERVRSFLLFYFVFKFPVSCSSFIPLGFKNIM